MEVFKCPWCGKALSRGDTIYQIRMVQGDGKTLWGACCSEECACQKQEQLIILHQSRVNDMRNQSFQKMRLHDFASA